MDGKCLDYCSHTGLMENELSDKSVDTVARNENDSGDDE